MSLRHLVTTECNRQPDCILLAERKGLPSTGVRRRQQGRTVAFHDGRSEPFPQSKIPPAFSFGCTTVFIAETYRIY